MNGLLTVVYFLFTLSVVMSISFGLRSYHRFSEWHNGDKDALWPFLSLSIAAAAAITTVIGMISFIISGFKHIEGFYVAFTIILTLSIVALGISVLSLFLKWKKLS